MICHRELLLISIFSISLISIYNSDSRKLWDIKLTNKIPALNKTRLAYYNGTGLPHILMETEANQILVVDC